jgi:hypothetical protein
MALGEVITDTWRSPEFGTVLSYRADEALARHLPDLALPRMPEAARAAFQAILAYEKPPSNRSLDDILGLAEARGFCADPRDWIPDMTGGHPPLYQPWVDWLSEQGITPFHEGNTLTAENWDRWKPKPLREAFSLLVIRNQRAAVTDFVLHLIPHKPAAQRAALLAEISAGPSFSGTYPWQVPLLRHFLNDSTARIRSDAEARLRAMHGMETEEAHAAALASHLRIADGRVRYAIPPEPHTYPFWAHWHSTSFTALAHALGLTPGELAQQADFDNLGSNAVALVISTGDAEARTMLARHLLDQPEPAALPRAAYDDLDPELARPGSRHVEPRRDVRFVLLRTPRAVGQSRARQAAIARQPQLRSAARRGIVRRQGSGRVCGQAGAVPGDGGG